MEFRKHDTYFFLSFHLAAVFSAVAPSASHSEEAVRPSPGTTSLKPWYHPEGIMEAFQGKPLSIEEMLAGLTFQQGPWGDRPEVPSPG